MQTPLGQYLPAAGSQSLPRFADEAHTSYVPAAMTTALQIAVGSLQAVAPASGLQPA